MSIITSKIGNTVIEGKNLWQQKERKEGTKFSSLLFSQNDKFIVLLGGVPLFGFWS